MKSAQLRTGTSQLGVTDEHRSVRNVEDQFNSVSEY